MDEKKIKVYAEIGELLFDVYVTVSQEAWEKELDSLEQEVRDDIANCECDEDIEEDFDEEADDDSSANDDNYYGGYIGQADGYSHGYTSAQGQIANHLVSCQFGRLLEHLGVLEQLRDAIVRDLVESDTHHRHDEELQMLKSIKNFVQAMLGEDEYDYDYCADCDSGDEKQVITIWDRYPLELLDELAVRVYGVPQKKTIVYLHGYGSSSQSSTMKYLAKNMPEYNVIAPDIPIDPEEALPFLKDYCRTHHADLVIGTSMGGMYAMQMAGMLRICVNPALHLSEVKDVLQVGTFERFQPTADGQTHYTITEEIIKHFKEMEQNLFVCETNESRFDCWGFFADGDTLVNCKDEFALHFPRVFDFHGEHRMNNAVLRDVIIPAAKRILTE
ncbi:MAG: hypothetical protein J6N71_08400 [Muribaculaceae bacterium]|nr:hypothetical protein [Muribaculaceae bacterium]